MSERNLEVKLSIYGQAQQQWWEQRKSQKRKSQRKEDENAQKVEKSRDSVVFQCFVGPEARKIGSLKRRVWRHLVRWEIKNRAVVAKRFGSKRGQSTSASEHFWKLRCRNSGRHWGTKHMSKSKRTKHTMFGAVLESQMLKRCSRLWPETHFKVKMLKAL